ncbi:unnamed protein product [Amoebophrya sp. A25]|nr:unnamed protein product [Amoebophrya sp. A25]|eukprot:GSA25T00014117001.1
MISTEWGEAKELFRDYMARDVWYNKNGEAISVVFTTNNHHSMEEVSASVWADGRFDIKGDSHATRLLSRWKSQEFSFIDLSTKLPMPANGKGGGPRSSSFREEMTNAFRLRVPEVRRMITEDFFRKYTASEQVEQGRDAVVFKVAEAVEAIDTWKKRGGKCCTAERAAAEAHFRPVLDALASGTKRVLIEWNLDLATMNAFGRWESSSLPHVILQQWEDWLLREHAAYSSSAADYVAKPCPIVFRVEEESTPVEDVRKFFFDDLARQPDKGIQSRVQAFRSIFEASDTSVAKHGPSKDQTLRTASTQDAMTKTDREQAAANTEQLVAKVEWSPGQISTAKEIRLMWDYLYNSADGLGLNKKGRTGAGASPEQDMHMALARTIVISGPPGVGKTLAALATLTELAKDS